MKRMSKITDPEILALFCRSPETLGEPVCVQGGKKRAKDGFLYVESGGRYKLFTEGVDYVKILSLQGKGFIKWARGEFPLSEGDAVAAEQPGEYEINGKCAFMAIRK